MRQLLLLALFSVSCTAYNAASRNNVTQFSENRYHERCPVDASSVPCHAWYHALDRAITASDEAARAVKNGGSIKDQAAFQKRAVKALAAFRKYWLMP